MEFTNKMNVAPVIDLECFNNRDPSQGGPLSMNKHIFTIHAVQFA